MVAFIVEKNDTFFYGMEEKHVGKQRRVGKERITQQTPFGLTAQSVSQVSLLIRRPWPRQKRGGNVS
jgi:hypothetical protein